METSANRFSLFPSTKLTLRHLISFYSCSLIWLGLELGLRLGLGVRVGIGFGLVT